MTGEQVQAQIRRVQSHPCEIVPEDLEAARKVLAESKCPCLAIVQRKLGIGRTYAEQLVNALKGSE